MFRILVLSVLTVMGLGASAQTAAEMANKYAHHEVYEVQPGIQVAAKFTSSGLVCEMKIQQDHFLKDKVDLTYGIYKNRTDDLIDMLVPPAERGKKDAQSGMTIAAGQSSETVERYENVEVHVLSTLPREEYTTLTLVIINWRHRSCVK